MILDIINIVSLTLVILYCILWLSILNRCPKFRLRSRYVIGTAVALVLWHLPAFITSVAKPQNVLCENKITSALNNNRVCTAQGIYTLKKLTIGFLLVFSTHAVVVPAFEVLNKGIVGIAPNCIRTSPDAKVKSNLPST